MATFCQRGLWMPPNSPFSLEFSWNLLLNGTRPDHVSVLSTMDLTDIILKLESLNGIKFGSFQLKNGITSPIYFDLRVIISSPKLLKDVSRVLTEKINSLTKPDLICGVPYTALPIASIISVETDLPMESIFCFNKLILFNPMLLKEFHENNTSKTNYFIFRS